MSTESPETPDLVDLRWLTLARLALWGIALGVGAAYVNERFRTPPAAIVQHQGKALIGGPFHLTAATGASISDRTLLGKPVLMAFGYTRDAELTPATLQVLGAILGRLGNRADRIATLLVTLDPEFDKPHILLNFMTQFDRRIIAATGTEGEIAALASAYRLPHGPIRGSIASPSALIEYEPLIYLMNFRGEYVTHWSQEASLSAIMMSVEALL